MQVKWQPRARADAVEIADYIEIDRPTAALAVYERIHQQIEMLGDYPLIGRIGRAPGTRELVITGTPYIAIYRVGTQVVSIVRLIHGARRWPPKR